LFLSALATATFCLIVRKTGNLNIVQFTDAHVRSYDDVKRTIGIIRTYH
jgi:hypothetical protein